MAKDETARLDRLNMFLEIMDIVESDPEIKAKLISMTKK